MTSSQAPENGEQARPTGATGATVATRSFLTDRPVAVLMLFLAAVVFGALSYQRLPVTLMPELSYPTLTVRTEYPGAAPEEVENDISRRVEEALGTVGGLRRMNSVSRAGISDVVLEFSWDTPMSDALQDTLEKLDLVFLPVEAEKPLILRFDPNLDPVLELSLSGDSDRFAGEEGLRRLRRIGELQVKRALEPIAGVAAVRVRGGLEEEIHVQLDAGALRRTNVSARQVIDRLAQENINVAGGTLKEGRTEYMVRTLNEFASLSEIAGIVITTVGGREVRVKDVASVSRSNKERQIVTRTNGSESVQLDVYKEADANMVLLAKNVRAAVGDFKNLGKEAVAVSGKGKARSDRGKAPRPSLTEGTLAERLFQAEGARLEVVADRSLFIEASITEVRSTALIGGLLAVVVLYLFLRNLVSTLFVAVSIPVSLLMTFAPLQISGVSLNIMSLGGLALGIGMLVDSSIVVLESIFRCREEGDDLVRAAIRGTAEVRSAVIASILTSIAVFFPMVFVEGVAGQAFGDLGFAVVISLLASLVAALGLIPMLASRRGLSLSDGSRQVVALRRWQSVELVRSALGRTRERGAASGPAKRVLWWLAAVFFVLRFVVAVVFETVGKVITALLMGLGWLAALIWPVLSRGFQWLTKGPLALTEKALEAMRRAYDPVLRRALHAPVAILALVVVLVALTGWMFSRLGTELLPEVRQGEFTVEAALPVGTPIEETLRLLEPVERAILEERDDFDSLLVTYGFDVTNTQRSDEGEHSARFKVLLKKGRSADEEKIVERLRRRFRDLPDVSARVSRPVLFSFKTPIEVEIVGDDLVRLRELSRQLEEKLQQLPELADVESTLRAGAPELQVVYNRDLLARYDLSISTVAELVRSQVRGTEATLYNLKDRRIPIIVQLEEADRRSVADLTDMVVNPGAERSITLGAIAEVDVAEGPSEVRRVDARRVALIRANLGAASLGRAVARIEQVLNEDVDWPADMTFVVSGQSEEWQRSQASLWLALGLSVFLVYVIMAAQFESLLQPLVIMFTIPLAFFGTAATLLLFGVNLSIVVFLGAIMLAGIVVNNAIVLVDYINTLRARGLALEEAIVAAGSVRLRPILMTTATTVLGLLPMALGLGEGAEIRTPMALAVIGGLLTSTALTLVVIPVVYSLVTLGAARVLGSSLEWTETKAGKDPVETAPALPSGVATEPGS